MYKIFIKILEERKITVYKVAKATGISTATMTQWKKGISTPKQDKLKKIADYLGVSVDYLMTGKEPEPNIQITDESGKLIILDDDTIELIDSLRSKPEMKMLFSVSRNATKEDIIKAVKIIEALKDDSKK